MAMNGNSMNRAAFKAQMMTMSMLLIFILMFAVMFIFVLINIQYNRISAGTGPAASSVALASVLTQSSFAFANASARTAAAALNYYVYNSSLGATNTLFNLNTSKYVAYLIANGTVPGSGSYAYVANYGSSNVVIVNTATNTVIGSITAGFSSPIGVAFAPSGAYAYVLNDGTGNIVIINTATSSVVGAITSGFLQPYLIAIAPNGAYAYVANYNANNVVIINTGTGSVVGSITTGITNPVGVTFTPNGAYAYITNLGSANVVVFNTASGTVVGTIAITGPYGDAITPSGTEAYIATYGPNNVGVVSTATGVVGGFITGGMGNPVDAAFSPSGSYAYITNFGSSNVVIVNTASNVVVGSVTGGFSQPYGVAFEPLGGGSVVNNYFKRAMGSLNLKSYNAQLLGNFSSSGLVSVNETNLKVAQQGPFNFYVSYVENLVINQTYGVSSYSIPVNLTVSGLSYYVPITLTNSQSSGTGSNFQQMLTINSLAYQNYISPGWSNVEFTTGAAANGNVLQAWVESNALSTSTNTIVWVKLPGGIPASSSNTIYMNFMPYNVMSRGGPTGEAPQLSATYGQYDNGPSVFNFYDGFVGNTLSSKWTVASGTSGTDYKTSNGLQLLTTTSIIKSTSSFGLNSVVEGYFDYVTSPANGWDFGVFTSYGNDYSLFSDGSWWYNTNGAYTEISGSAVTLPAYYIWQLVNNAGSVTVSARNPSYLVVQTGTFSNPTASGPITFGQRYDGSSPGQADSMIFDWIRTRTTPPAGIMPTQLTGNFV